MALYFLNYLPIRKKAPESPGQFNRGNCISSPEYARELDYLFNDQLQQNFEKQMLFYS
jgi:hypothetical protein